MSYMEFKPLVKKVNLKPKGIVEIVLETSITDLQGKIDPLSSMIDRRAEASLDSLVVNYNVAINTKTNKPVVNYKVDDSGVVHEVKPEGEQIEAELGLPKEKILTKEEQEEAERSVIDDFIREGFAPQFDDLPYDFQSIISRKLSGETYMKIASELDMSSGKIVELVDEYRSRVAPMALKWDEWRKGKDKPKAANEKKEDKPAEQADANTENKNSDSPDDVAASKADQGETEGSTHDPEQQGQDASGVSENDADDHGAEKQEDAAAAIDKETLEAFILSGQAPVFEEIEYDFPALLARRKAGETWLKIAPTIGTSSTKLQAAWSRYKKLVTDHMAKQNGGEPGAA
ncbi:hypothetical protein [Brevibacillus sp. 1238]|uniref:hypothetical protein n=1 Tax=Brevibacillus sp. 1238 TaxID=2940565 RepID=UPI002475A5CF|nr:hypothetical protein [Brevibacillus sp. 1238]MDH6351897.1 hypothetical protein [Brevibacillus sp. 1238]